MLVEVAFAKSIGIGNGKSNENRPVRSEKALR